MDLSKYSKERLYKLAYRDVITEYYNWNYLWEKLIEINNNNNRKIDEFNFILFDVKDFNQINDCYSHKNANELLKFICSAIDPGKKDWIYYSCRCDNDNFAIMAKPFSEEIIRELLNELFEGISHLPWDSSYKVSYRCGVYLVEKDMPNKDQVADLVKVAKKKGKKTNVTEIFFYDDKMKEAYFYSKHLKRELPKAIKNEELLVYLQPKYDTYSEKISGAEALVRWNYHHEKLLMPREFIPLFEKEGLIAQIDRFVLKKVCQKFAQWKKEGLPLLPISVNISRLQLNQPNLVETLTEIVDEYEVEHDLIDFELTETISYEDSRYMIEMLNRFRELGFKLSMDDFGTGYSSLRLLKDMPLDTIKIDKNFVDGIELETDNEKECWIVKEIISIADHMNIISLAEGVEHLKQKKLLKDWGCKYIQGYYYSKPIPIQEYERKLWNIPNILSQNSIV